MTTMNPVWDRMIQLLESGVTPATGCTEPVAVAYAAAVAARDLQGEAVTQITVKVSRNIMKNAMAVIVPGTGTPGLAIAAAVGALGGDPDGGLQVLRTITDAISDAGKALVAKGAVTVSVVEVPHVLYADVTVESAHHTSTVCIADAHTQITYHKVDGKVVWEEPPAEKAEVSEDTAFLQSLHLRDVYDFATQVPLDAIAFMKRAAELNDELARLGLREPYGLGVGRSIQQSIADGYLTESLIESVVMGTAAASDARMGGAPLPAMTNSGSGNQGIAASEPVAIVAALQRASEEDLIRALTLSNLVAIYIHSFLPKLSALCAVSTAGMGAAAGVVWLLKKSYEPIVDALSTMTGDIMGMICDGASSSCATKVATTTQSAMRAVMMALQGHRTPGTDGIVSRDVDESIRNIGKLACEGMAETDPKILEIMMHKNQ